MATVIDAFIVTLGLDAKSFTGGWDKNNKNIQEGSKKTAEAIDKVRNQVLALFAIFTAGKGLKEFVLDITSTLNALGRLAPQLHETTQELSQWRGAAEAVGGTADGITSSIAGLVDQFQQFSITGESSVIPYFRALGISISDSQGRMRNVGDIFLDLAEKFKTLDPARARAFGQALGLDQGTINLLIQGRAAVQNYLDVQKKLGTVTAEDAKAGMALTQQLAYLNTSSTTLGRTLLTAFAPALIKVLEFLTKVAVFASEHKPFLQAFFVVLAAGAVAITVALAPIVGTVAGITAALVIMATEIAFVYDDLRTFAEGGKSVFGAFFNFVKGFATSLPSLFSSMATGIFNAVASAVSAALGYIQDHVNSVWKTVFGHDLFTKGTASGAKKAPAKGTGPSTAAGAAIDYVLRHEDSTLSGKVTNDQGGITKYGISSKANPGVDVANLNLDQARAIYKAKYWDAIGGDSLPSSLQATALDSAINEGVGLTKTWLKQSGGNVAVFNALRAQRYESLAQQNPAKYGGDLKGWLNRLGPAPGGLPAASAGVAAAYAKNGNVSHSTRSSETHIDQVIVNTAATDANGIARDIKSAIENDAFAAHLDNGPG